MLYLRNVSQRVVVRFVDFREGQDNARLKCVFPFKAFLKRERELKN